MLYIGYLFKIWIVLGVYLSSLPVELDISAIEEYILLLLLLLSMTFSGHADVFQIVHDRVSFSFSLLGDILYYYIVYSC